jgi:hypothetical protein
MKLYCYIDITDTDRPPMAGVMLRHTIERLWFVSLEDARNFLDHRPSTFPGSVGVITIPGERACPSI